MKYFKLTNIKDKDDEWEFYVSSTLENETPENLCRALLLDADQYEITEVTKEEFEREAEEDISEGLLFGRRDMDLPDDDWEDEDDEWVD